MSTGALWFAWLGGPVAWSAHLLASYAVVPLACRFGTTTPLNALTAGTALIAAAAGVVGLRGYRRLGRAEKRVRGSEPSEDPAGRGPADPIGRGRFMAIGGIMVGFFFAFAILLEGLPSILQDPCTRF